MKFFLPILKNMCDGIEKKIGKSVLYFVDTDNITIKIIGDKETINVCYQYPTKYFKERCDNSLFLQAFFDNIIFSYSKHM